MQEIRVSAAFAKINGLSQEQREKAYREARKRVAGDPPVKASVEGLNANAIAFSKYPPNVTNALRLLSVPILVAAFIPSAIRIFIAFFLVTQKALQADVILQPHANGIALLVAICAVLLSESGQVAFTLWASTTDSRVMQFALYAAAVCCTLFALVANAEQVKPFASYDPNNVTFEFALKFLDAFVPPALVLIAANVLKAQILHLVEARHRRLTEHANAIAKAERDYRDAKAIWDRSVREAHLSPSWKRNVVLTLKDALKSANRNKEHLRALTDADWFALITREIEAEETLMSLFDRQPRLQTQIASEEPPPQKQLPPITQIAPRPKRKSANGKRGGKATGEVLSAKLEVRPDGTHVRTCPVCELEFEGATAKDATNRLAAHFKKHVRERRAMIANGK